MNKPETSNQTLQRRNFLKLGTAGMSAFLLGAQGCSNGSVVKNAMYTDIGEIGELLEPDENGMRLPPGFKSRILARSGQPVEGGSDSYIWHAAPDGGDCFEMDDGGWIYVSNSEMSLGRGGVGALRFDKNGDVIDSYPILEGTHVNCAGGKTPWQTWLSCEETNRGLVYECDPTGEKEAVERPLLGRFRHEAVAVDPVHEHLFLTEDEVDGRFYRFIPEGEISNLDAGTLQVAEISDVDGVDKLVWHDVRDPYASFTSTREQVRESTAFAGGEGIVWYEGVVYFATKHDNRVWAYDTVSHEITVLYDLATSPTPILSGVDNLAITAAGDVLVAEDGGDMQLVLLSLDGDVLPVMQLVGHDRSEVTGPAFNQHFSRMYFSSQRGEGTSMEEGMTFEISRV